MAYGIAILQNSWYLFDIKDWGVYCFERSRLTHRPCPPHHSPSPSSPSSSSSSLLSGSWDFFHPGSYLILSPLLTVTADLLTLRLYPPLVACLLVYYFVNLDNSWDAKITFVTTILLLSVLGVLLCRCIAVLTLASFKTSEVQARSSLVSTSLFCFFVLYAGFLLNPDDLPASKYVIRDWSMYYWVSE
jgi:hypothetical protein